MHKFLIPLIVISTFVLGERTVVWPELSEFQFTSGRQATEDDINSGAAVFMLEVDGKNIGRPIDILIPQYAIHIDQETGERSKVVIIQAEESDVLEAIGAINIATNEYVAALRFEFEFLGQEPPSVE